MCPTKKKKKNKKKQKKTAVIQSLSLKTRFLQEMYTILTLIFRADPTWIGMKKVTIENLPTATMYFDSTALDYIKPSGYYIAETTDPPDCYRIRLNTNVNPNRHQIARAGSCAGRLKSVCKFSE